MLIKNDVFDAFLSINHRQYEKWIAICEFSLKLSPDLHPQVGTRIQSNKSQYHTGTSGILNAPICVATASLVPQSASHSFPVQCRRTWVFIINDNFIAPFREQKDSSRSGANIRIVLRNPLLRMSRFNVTERWRGDHRALASSQQSELCAVKLTNCFYSTLWDFPRQKATMEA